MAQAAKLYNSKAGATLDVDHLHKGASFYVVSASDPLDFRSAMEGIDGARAQDRHGPAGRPPPPPLPHEFMTRAQRPSSDATSLDELPALVVHSLDGVGWACLCGGLGEMCYWLSTVLHLCLRKKLPDYLVANSGPIVLEANLCRLNSGCVFRRFQVRAEWADFPPPPSHYAYRGQLSPQLCAVFCRWGIAYWACLYGALCLANWDESNAFCNVLSWACLNRLWPEYLGLRMAESAEKCFWVSVGVCCLALRPCRPVSG